MGIVTLDALPSAALLHVRPAAGLGVAARAEGLAPRREEGGGGRPVGILAEDALPGPDGAVKEGRLVLAVVAAVAELVVAAEDGPLLL